MYKVYIYNLKFKIKITTMNQGYGNNPLFPNINLRKPKPLRQHLTTVEGVLQGPKPE